MAGTSKPLCLTLAFLSMFALLSLFSAHAAGGTAEVCGEMLPYRLEGSSAIFYPDGAQLRRILEKYGERAPDFDLSGAEGAKSAAIELDPSVFTGSPLLISFGGCSLLIPEEILSSLSAAPGKIAVAFQDVGFYVTRDGREALSGDNIHPFIFSVPYFLPDGASPDSVVMVSNMGESDPAHIIPRSWYRDGRVFAKTVRPGAYTPRNLTWGVFSDTKNRWMDEAALYLSARGVMQGVTNPVFAHGVMTARFAPEMPVTRAEFTVMLMRLIDVRPEAAGTPPFSDAPQDAVYFDSLLGAKSLGIVTGADGGRFHPDAPLSRQDMLVMSFRAMKRLGMIKASETGAALRGHSDFGDISGYAAVPLASLAEAGLLSGIDGKLCPLKTATRAEAAWLLFDILRRDAGRTESVIPTN